MTLKKLREELEKHNPALVLPTGFTDPRYTQIRGRAVIAFTPFPLISIGKILESLKDAEENDEPEVYLGYRGGDLEELGPSLLYYMLREGKEPRLMEYRASFNALLCLSVYAPEGVPEADAKRKVIDTLHKLDGAPGTKLNVYSHKTGSSILEIDEVTFEEISPAEIQDDEYCDCASCGQRVLISQGASTPSGSMHNDCASRHRGEHPEEW